MARPAFDGVRVALLFIALGAVLGAVLWPLVDTDAGLGVSARTGAVLGLLLWGLVMAIGSIGAMLATLFKR